jgi:Holliday junction resolvase RusA-like endonuclease
MTPIVIELAGEPQGKGRPRFVRSTGHAYTPAATRSYETTLRLAAQAVMAGRIPIDGAVEVEVLACMPIPASWSRVKRSDAITGMIKPTSRPDVDNLVKMLDAFNEIVWRDDKQVVSCWVSKVYSDKPRLRVEVRAAA